MLSTDPNNPTQLRTTNAPFTGVTNGSDISISFGILSSVSLSCHVRKLGQPIGADPTHFHLIASYETDPRRWEKLQWIDQYSGNRYRIGTIEAHGSRTTARVKSYGELLLEYEFHPEPKCLDVSRKVCGKRSIGLLSRRPFCRSSRLDSSVKRPIA